MSLTFDEYNALGEVIDKSWARSSTAYSGSPTMTVDCRLLNDERMMLTYTTVVNTMGAAGLHQQMQVFEDEGMQVIDQYIKATKDAFKERAGRALKLKVLDHRVETEMVNMSTYNPKRTAYVRVIAIAEYE